MLHGGLRRRDRALHGMCAAVFPHGIVELLRLLKVAEVAAVGQDDKRCIRHCLLELARDAHGRPDVTLPPEQQRGNGDTRKHCTQVRLRDRRQLDFEAVPADLCRKFRE